jgi:L-asparaginase
MKRRILLVGTGGTIGTARGRTGLNEVTQSVEAVVRDLTELSELVNVEVRDQWRLPSSSMTPSKMRELAEIIDSASRAGFQGVVVTHGTDTIEETAYALALMLGRNIPIALTGAMRPPTSAGAEGLGNLLGAFTFVASRQAAALGPCVVIQDEVHLARFVSKVHTSRLAAFASPGLGSIGEIAEGKLRLGIMDAPNDFLGLPKRLERRVELIWAVAGGDGRLIQAAAEAADGIVIAAMGGGHLPTPMAQAAGEAVKRGVPVVLASRTGSGAVLEGTYGGTGSESELYSMGLIPAGSLSPVKARLRLLVGLELGRDVRSLFV